jgi:hypothetical protein
LKPEKYRPSNGTEGMLFYEEWCESCEKQGCIEEGPHCEIMNRTLEHDREDEMYPDEWCYDEQGVACCTAYRPSGNKNTQKCMDLREQRGQMRLF